MPAASASVALGLFLSDSAISFADRSAIQCSSENPWERGHPCPHSRSIGASFGAEVHGCGQDGHAPREVIFILGSAATGGMRGSS